MQSNNGINQKYNTCYDKNIQEAECQAPKHDSLLLLLVVKLAQKRSTTASGLGTIRGGIRVVAVPRVSVLSILGIIVIV